MKFKDRLPVILKATCLGCAFAVAYITATPKHNNGDKILNDYKQKVKAEFSMIKPFDPSQHKVDTAYVNSIIEHKIMMSKIDSIQSLNERDSEEDTERQSYYLATPPKHNNKNVDKILYYNKQKVEADFSMIKLIDSSIFNVDTAYINSLKEQLIMKSKIYGVQSRNERDSEEDTERQSDLDTIGLK